MSPLHVQFENGSRPHEPDAGNISPEDVTTNKLVDCEGNMSETRRESENRRDSSDDFSMHPILKFCVASRPPGKALLLRGCNCSSDLVFDFIGHVTAIQAYEYRGVRDCRVCLDEQDTKGLSRVVNIG